MKAIENMGEKTLNMMTGEGVEVQGTWQVVDIVRPLMSVRQICKQGNRVIFGMFGGVIQNLATGSETHFGVEDNIYTMDMWLPPVSSNTSVFQRQG